MAKVELKSPPLIWRLIAQDDPDIYLETVNQSEKGILSKIFGKRVAEPSHQVPDLELIEGEGMEDDLDKSWQGIHYCLNQTDYEAEPPMDFMTVGGKAAGDIDVGYGPARLFDSKTVKELEETLSSVSADTLRSHYDPVKMEALDIYPKIWTRDGDEAFAYIADYYETLKSFLSHCSKHDLGMAVYLR
ncbi:YfbM family protein [Thiorhodococcus mannitoliphagus]|uniref:YfbM family protein n=1 Tax=Thiorhodococcus mannitoliphagus TaxID=329406 RepID=A0A6P1DXE4_9GAMM|nr:YfbM family protein [Thiorhodococcus mannitoliphagus]NEX22150.1 YfbM family protein [Thiorhodococcus mannitoliphagus]